MIIDPTSIVDALPATELSESAVEELADHDAIDRTRVELKSDALGPQGYRTELVEAFWVEIDGTAHVLQYENNGWAHRGTFEPDGLEDHELTETAFEKINY
ncbi:hypothetical protein [Halobaculum sp. P14]|uniref:hypothetical protein n=1 Tax=Halobaculum sp. P14 TaxID=3421638 RepID=UPI003EB6E1BE